jgi:ribose 5-phosphate isomerase B
MPVPPETIAIAADHGGVALKETLIAVMEARGLTVLDLGTNTEEAVDYPDFAERVVAAIIEGRAGRGVLLCGSGIGMIMSANRHPEIRAALVSDPEIAVLARQHNNANVLVMGGRFTPPDVAKNCLSIFLDTEFEVGGRHERRVAKMS